MAKLVFTTDVNPFDISGAPWSWQDGFSGGSAFGAMSLQAAPGTALYLTEAGDAKAISVNDIHQGQIGDCFLLSAMGEIALTHPSFISNMIHVNADGSETVTLHEASNGQLPSFSTSMFKTVAETVVNSFLPSSVNSGAAQAVVNGVKEIWPQVLEKAVAELNGGYDAISYGGNPVIAMEELTGNRATSFAPKQVSATMLNNFVAQGNLMTFDTATSNSTYNLVGGHSYMFTGLTTVGGAPAAVLANPWGFNQPSSAIPLSQLSKVFVEIDVGRV